ncbi:MAG: ferrous iron transport protein B, partial [Draconibacterium sp.]|nr:ferrous iron transport protein B [Draconibacterium sp.]
AFITAQILNKTVFKNKETPFVMELPAYRLPTFRNIVYHMWDKTQHYLKKIGSVVLIGVIIIWALEYFPRKTEKSQYFANEISIIQNNSKLDETEKEYQIETIKQELESNRLTNSYLGRIGKGIQPALQPLGFDWKMSISLLAGLPAKEIIVSTMGVLYQSNDSESTVNLQNKIQNEHHKTEKLKGQKVFVTPSILSFLIFILIYFPCFGVIATIKSESGSWKWAAFTVIYTTLLAWVAAFVVFNVSSLFF